MKNKAPFYNTKRVSITLPEKTIKRIVKIQKRWNKGLKGKDEYTVSRMVRDWVIEGLNADEGLS